MVHFMLDISFDLCNVVAGMKDNPIRKEGGMVAKKKAARKKVAKKKVKRAAAKKPAKKVRCAAKTLAGKRCKRYVTGKSKYCAAHR